MQMLLSMCLDSDLDEDDGGGGGDENDLRGKRDVNKTNVEN